MSEIIRGIPISERGRANFTNYLRTMTSTKDFRTHIQFAGLSPEDVPRILTDGSLLSELVDMMSSPDQHRLQLGVVFSQVGIRDFPQALFDLLHPVYTSEDATINTSNASWELCPASEPLFTKSVRDKAVMAIGSQEPHLLLKFNGVMTGLCLTDVVTPSGTMFVQGNWYSPTDVDNREQLKDAFDSGLGKFPLAGAWTLMRAYKSTNGTSFDTVMKRVREVAHKIPSRYKPSYISQRGYNVSRKTYRRMNEEELYMILNTNY